ncbi:MAG: glycoside hydrolase family 43 protein [Chloroflexota bacterium]
MREPFIKSSLMRLLLPVLVLFIISGCGQNATPSPTAAPPTAIPPTATLPASTPTAAATATPAATATVAIPEGSFANPVLRSDFPDPGLLFIDGVYYAYATNSEGKNVQMAKSIDLVDWTMLPDALPALPSWANTDFGFVWAPEVIKISDRYVLYYVARVKDTSTQCIGVATSDKPEGPFTDANDKPSICQMGSGGSIDPSPFLDGDKLYLYWKNDGNCCGSITYIYEQELAPDGLGLMGEPVKLVSNDKRWEGLVVEAPTMWKQGDAYYLFFSANNYASVDYAIGYATCESAAGPCKDAAENPILKTKIGQPPAIGPGHQTIVLDKDGETWMVYHVWAVPTNGQLERRFMWLDRLTWEDGKPHVHGPTTAPQPDP